MIFGVGVDVVELSRIERVTVRYGNRFAQRILSEQEWAEYLSGAHSPRFLAKRFAAKEAFAKALGSGLREPVTLRRISVCHDRLGKPGFRFDELLQRYLAECGVDAQHLSISDERSLIVAFVVLESSN
jgi:holo-[acyl-carrier protein] synthase